MKSKTNIRGCFVQVNYYNRAMKSEHSGQICFFSNYSTFGLLNFLHGFHTCVIITHKEIMLLSYPYQIHQFIAVLFYICLPSEAHCHIYVQWNLYLSFPDPSLNFYGPWANPISTMAPASIVFPDPLFLFQTPDKNDE
jgi:hypothetical protein